MAVNTKGKNILSVTLLSEDDGKSLKISSGDVTLLEKILNHKQNSTEDAAKYTLEIEVPEEVINKAKEIEAYGSKYEVIPVTISGKTDEESARIVEYIYILES